MRAMAVRWMWSSVAALIIMLAGAPPANAQGFYYKEIRKDDRIYVFNIAANAERFEKTGEMGRGLTRPGVGPKGETVVGDSERALQLFFFKHGISEAGARADRRRSSPSSGATARRASRPTSRTSRSRTASRCGTRTSSRTTLRRRCPGPAAPGDATGRSASVARSSSSKGGSGFHPGVAPRPNLPKLTYELQLNWAAVGVNVGASRQRRRAPRGRQHRVGSAGARASSASCSASSRRRSAGRR